MRKLLRYLRIAFSVGCGALCVLLIVLWVRSYGRQEVLYTPYFELQFVAGKIFLFPQVNASVPWAFRSMDIDDPAALRQFFEANPANASGSMAIVIPVLANIHHWFLLLLIALVGALPWMRYSLRTLLIAVTLIAAIIGLIVFASMK